VGVLYKLYYQHPAIDFFELLKGSDGALYLLMVQASLSYYVDHKAKLDKKYDTYNEFMSATVLQYYKNLCRSEHKVIMFMYHLKRRPYQLLWRSI